MTIVRPSWTVGPAPAAPAARRRIDWIVLVPTLVTLAITLSGIGAASFWRDEAATLDADDRPLTGLLRLLGHVDAVHGGYYLLLWPLIHTAGGSEFAVRLPSALAMTAAAAGVAALGRRLHSGRAGLLAGLVFAVLPEVSRYGQEARSYALVTACAVLASYLLVRAVAESRRRWLIGYGCAVAALGVLNLFGLLLVAGHVVFVAGQARQRLRDWLVGASLGCLPVLPIGVLAWRQRAQLAWVTTPDAGAGGELAVWLAGSVSAAVLTGVLIGLGLGRRPGRHRAAWLALPWLVLPPAILLLVSEVTPVYVPRYVTFCLPALALSAGVGLAVLAVAPRVAGLVLIAVLGWPVQSAIRQPDGHGDDIRGEAAVLTQYGRPGDGYLYYCPTCAEQYLPADFGYAYPQAFARLNNLGLAATPSESGTLTGTSVSPALLRERLAGVSRLWLIEVGGHTSAPILAGSGLHLGSVHQADGITLELYLR